MPIIDVSKIEGVKIPSPFARRIKEIMTPDTQDAIKDFSITMGIIDPHSQNDLHTHEITELIYIMTGYGRCMLGDDSFDIKPDMLIINPPNVKHQQFNDSDETMKMFCIWSPAATGEEVINRAIATNKV